MNNEKFSSYHRSLLAEQVPLNTPAVLALEASSRCCFNCYYCYHAFLDNNNRFNSDMELDTFKKIIADACAFDGQIDTLVFARFGEPLMNKHIVRMVKLAKESNIFKQVKIITNAYLLNKDLGKGLIDAGLDVLEVSLQALNGEEYKRITGVKVDPQYILKNLSDIKNISDDLKIVIKIFDDHISTSDPKLRQFDVVADSLIVEHIIDLDNGCDLYLSKHGNNRTVCSQPFYTINVDSQGNILPCCGDVKSELANRNVKDTSIYDYWNGENLRNFQLCQLTGNAPLTCNICKGAQIYSPKGCDLDTDKSNIIKKIVERRSNNV